MAGQALGVLGRRCFDWRVNSPASSTPSLVRPLSARQLSAFRSRLEHELSSAHDLEARLREQIAESLESRRSTTNDETDDPEGSNLAFEGAQTASMLKQTTAHAAEVTAALQRVDAGTYGMCERCAGAIATGRLEARPSSALCIACAS